MKEPTDEQLMSFADGELDAETRAWVADAIEKSPELARKVAMYRATGRILGDIVARDMPRRDKSRQTDDDLARKILAHPLPTSPKPAHPQSGRPIPGRPTAVPNGRDTRTHADKGGGSGGSGSGGTVVQFPGRATQRRGGGPNLAAAAAVAALLASALAMTMVEWRSSRPNTATTVSGRTQGISETGDATTLSLAALGGVLERTLSRQAVPVDGNWIVTPVNTFKARDGRYCREYTAGHGTTSAVHGLACRTAEARWISLVQAPIKALPKSAANGTVPAERVAPPVVGDTVTGMMDDIVLGAEAEADLIARRWKTGN